MQSCLHFQLVRLSGILLFFIIKPLAAPCATIKLEKERFYRAFVAYVDAES